MSTNLVKLQIMKLNDAFETLVCQIVRENKEIMLTNSLDILSQCGIVQTEQTEQTILTRKDEMQIKKTYKITDSLGFSTEARCNDMEEAKEFAKRWLPSNDPYVDWEGHDSITLTIQEVDVVDECSIEVNVKQPI